MFSLFTNGTQRAKKSWRGRKTRGSRATRRREPGGNRHARFEVLEPRLNLSADWLVGLGGAGQDVARAGIETDASDNVYVAGDFFDTIQLDPGGSAAGLLTSNGSRDVFVGKYDSSGALQWARSFGGVGEDQAWGLALDGSANVIVTGAFSDTVDFDLTAADPQGADTLTSVGGFDGYVAKLNTNGQFQWVGHMAGDNMAGNNFDNITLADVDRDGNIYVGTQTNSTQVTFGALAPVSGGNGQFSALAKIDAAGTFQWVRDFQNGAGEIVRYVVPVVDDRAVDAADWSVTVVGSYDGQLSIGTSNLSSQGERDTFLAQFDTGTGQQTLAVNSFGGPGRDQGLSLDIDAAGNIYVTGNFEQQVDFDGSAVQPDGRDIRSSNGGRDIFILKLDQNFGFQAVTSFGGVGADQMAVVNSITVSQAGDVLVAGEFEGSIDLTGFSLVSSGEVDGLVLTLDNGLNLQWAERFGGAGDSGGSSGLNSSSIGLRQSESADGATGVAFDSLGNVYVAGDFKQTGDFPTGDRLTSSGDADLALMKLDMSQPRISGNIFADFNANGVRDERLREGILESDGWMVELVDASGVIVDSVTPLGNSGNFSFGTVAPGTYTVRQVLPAGWIETTPGAGHVITVAAGDAPVHVEFGNDIPTESAIYQSSDVGKKIGINQTITSQLVVSDELTIFDLDVQLDITHVIPDSEASLIAPDGTEIPLWNGFGAYGQDFSGTILDDDAAIAITSGTPPYTGRFRPEGNLAALAGQQAQGTWQLRVNNISVTNGPPVRLNDWSLTIFGTPPPPPPPPAPSFAIDDISITEGDSGTATAQFTVTRAGDVSQPVSVDYATSDGTATAGSDYTGIGTTTLTFAPGVTSLPVAVAVIGDANQESDETFFVNLSNPVGATISAAQGVGTILDDDSPVNLAELFVYDIRFDSKRRGKDYRAVFEIRSDSDGDGQGTANDNPVAGVSVTVTFAGKTYTGVTDSNGVFRTNWQRKLASGDYYANAVDLALTDFTWNPLALDLEDDSDGDGNPDQLLTL